jgi:hypothetical protein
MRLEVFTGMKVQVMVLYTSRFTHSLAVQNLNMQPQLCSDNGIKLYCSVIPLCCYLLCCCCCLLPTIPMCTIRGEIVLANVSQYEL